MFARFSLVTSAFFATSALGQRVPTLDDVEQIAVNQVAAAKSYLAAAQAAGLSQGALANAAKSGASAGGSAGAAGCVRDLSTGACLSFLSTARASPSMAAVIRPFVQRVYSGGVADSRETQAPLVWMKFRHSDQPAISGQSFADFANARTSLLAEPVMTSAGNSAIAKTVETLSAAKSSSAYAAATSASSQNFANLLQRGANAMANEVADDLSLADLRSKAFQLTHINMRKHLYSGGCARDFSGCPAEYTESNSACAPDVSYGGFCGAFSASASAVEKSSLAWKCAVSWPCAN